MSEPWLSVLFIGGIALLLLVATILQVCFYNIKNKLIVNNIEKNKKGE